MLCDFWYVAALAEDVDRGPIERIVCNRPIVVFRGESGSLNALQNFCSHRRAPLSLGRVMGEAIECPYHGMRFAGDGTCTLIPCQSDIPSRANVQSYPVVERHGFVWVWPGDPTLADPATVPEMPWRDDPAWNSDTVYYYHVKGSHILMTDNLLDLGHVAFIHADTIGFAPEGLEEDPLVTEVQGDRIVNTRVFRDVQPSPAVKGWGNFKGTIERESVSTWSPPCFTSIYFANRDATTQLEMRIDHLITPETDTTHNYWVSVCRNFRIDDMELDAQMLEDNDRVHQQDLEIVEAQQRMIDLVPDYQDMPIRQDKPLTIAHRVMARLEKQESDRRQERARAV